MSAGQPALLLVVDWNSQVISSAVHDYSHLIHNSTCFTAMIQLKPGIPPASLNQPRSSADCQKNKAAKETNTGLHFERVFSDVTISPFDQIQ